MADTYGGTKLTEKEKAQVKGGRHQRGLEGGWLELFNNFLGFVQRPSLSLRRGTGRHGSPGGGTPRGRVQKTTGSCRGLLADESQ